MTNDKINDVKRVAGACAYEQGSSAGGVTPQCWTSTWHRALPGSSNNVTREYTWGLNMGGGIGGLLNVKQSGQNYSYLYDGKGNVTAVIDSAEATAATYTYDAFGNLMVKTGSLDQPFQFSTKRYDAQTGLVYYGYRFYSPVQGRWVTRDPLGEAGGINLYRFVGNSPINWIDFLGLIIYNKKPPKTVPVTGKTKKALECLEKCVYENKSKDILVTGGAETSGHSENSLHYEGKACDIAGPKFNQGITDKNIKACAKKCGFTHGQYEDKPGDNADHWHFQIGEGLNVPKL